MEECRGGKFAELPAEGGIDFGVLRFPGADTRVPLASAVQVEADWDDVPVGGDFYAGVAVARDSAITLIAGKAGVVRAVYE